ncbi:hypothetical protein FK85_22285 [Halorubrum saccharovorum]|uniref:Uncharacterized protein n=1 Tax=Halorubrum saccharovorum TaxID=2248 RepID=A0A081EWL5_9EURY|nr:MULTISPECIES: hypothetical protein [Halorubrum]KDS90082.1 hypothetical protein FK85_22285 [Halorubrum saccharovorum]
MRLGLTDMIGLAASLIFALPLGLFAVNRLFTGEIAFGVGLLVVAAAMVVLPQYFLDPGRILRGLVVGLLPRQLRGLFALDPDEVASGDADSAEESAIEKDQTEATSEDVTTVEK